MPFALGEAVELQHDVDVVGQQRDLDPAAQAPRLSAVTGSIPGTAPTHEPPPMAAPNKCLARSNKTRHVIRATKDTNGHWTVGTAERPCVVRQRARLGLGLSAQDDSHRAHERWPTTPFGERLMKVVFSRKGFDSGAGGCSIPDHRRQADQSADPDAETLRHHIWRPWARRYC